MFKWTKCLSVSKWTLHSLTIKSELDAVTTTNPSPFVGTGSGLDSDSDVSGFVAVSSRVASWAVSSRVVSVACTLSFVFPFAWKK